MPLSRIHHASWNNNSYIISPALNYLESKKISRSVGFFIVFTLFILILVTLALTAIPTLIEEASNLITKLPEYITSAREKTNLLILELKARSPEPIAKYLNNQTFKNLVPTFNEGYIQSILSGLFTALLKGYSVTLTVVNLALLPFIAYYLSVDFKKIHKTALILCPKRFRSSVKEICSQIDVLVSAFIRGQISVCTILFFLYATGLGFIGVELWFLLAVISGFGNIIPYFGFLLGIVLSTVLTLATFGDMSHLYQVWIIYASVQFLEGTFITPKIVGDKVGISPLVVILSIFAFGKIFGLLGVFLAIPIAASIKVIGYYAHNWYVNRIDQN